MAPTPDARMVSSAVEDYLKAIYDLGGQAIKTQDLAGALGVSAASVTGMLKKLAELNLVDYQRYYGVGLTEAGRLIALETIRHHRLIETYLAQALGYAWHEVHAEADRLEHHISEDFEARIDDLLGNPTHDPHGDPIPRRDGTVPESRGVPLPELEPGLAARITRITNQRPEVLRYLAEQGLILGAGLSILGVAPFKGPLTIATDRGQIVLARDLAADIRAEVIA